jgi:hypothetical protein
MYHNVRKISLELEHNKIERAPHPGYFPTSARVIFGCLVSSKKFRNRSYRPQVKSFEVIPLIWNDITFKKLQSVFSDWIQ